MGELRDAKVEGGGARAVTDNVKCTSDGADSNTCEWTRSRRLAIFMSIAYARPTIDSRSQYLNAHISRIYRFAHPSYSCFLHPRAHRSRPCVPSITTFGVCLACLSWLAYHRVRCRCKRLYDQHQYDHVCPYTSTQRNDIHG